MMYSFLEANMPDIIDDILPIQFSEQSVGLLKSMFDHMQKGVESYIETIEKNTISMEPIDFKDQSIFPQGSNFDYCPNEVKKHIQGMRKVGNTFKFTLQGHKVIVHIICSSKKGDKLVPFMNSVIQRIYIWLYLAFQYSNEKCSKTMNIYLYMTGLEKTLPKTGSPIREINANTAFTTSCQESTEMHLFREEEWFKVFIHESFHNLGLDFSEFNHEKTNAEVLKIFPVSSDVRIFETYCEMWAEIIHCLFIVFFESEEREPDAFIEQTQLLLDKERAFSMFQCAKVLDFYGLDYKDLYERTTKSHAIRKLKYKEETHVLSYYIIKSIFMFYVNDYVEWCVVHNGNSLNFNKEIGKLDTNLMDYCTLIREHYNKDRYKDVLQAMDKWFDKNSTSTKENMKILKTLRMTVNDMQ